jgi:(p)ppGpp synthase/HD superfamily hydrolase
VEVEYQRGHGTLGPLLDAVSDSGGHVDDLSIDDDVDGRRSVTLEVRVHDDEELREAIRRVSDREEVARCTVHRM